MKLKFYTVDLNYLLYLYKIDPEVYFNPLNTNYKNKPYIGIIITDKNLKYFIPLTSAKKKHLNYKNSGVDYDLIFEYVPRFKIKRNNIYTLYKSNESDSTKDIMKRILAVLDYKKSIPICDGCYTEIDFKKSLNRDLLAKEYSFLLPKSMQRKINE